MADSTITGLTGATTPLAGTEVLPIVQSGVTKKVSVSDLTAGRSVSVSDLTATTGNIVIGTSGKGIDFSATPGSGTSELFNDYEEGTWTPTDGSGGGLSFTINGTSTYTKIGRQVILNADITYPVTADGNLTLISGLPFSPVTSPSGAGSIGYTDYPAWITIATGTTGFRFLVSAGLATNAVVSSKRIQVCVIYIV